jgi:deglycase
MRIACILAEGFEDSEFKRPYDALRAASLQLDVIGFNAGDKLTGDKGKVKVKTDKSIDQVRSTDYDALFIPGGHSPDKLRADPRFVRFVREFFDQSKPVAAICHGPQLFIPADVARGRRMTAWRTVQVDLKCTGADVVDEEVVVDRNLITSRQPSDLDAFIHTVVSELTRPVVQAEQPTA